MTNPNHAQSAATHTAASLSQRLHRLMVAVVPALFGMTLSSLSLAASPASHKDHPTAKPLAAARQPSAHASTTTTKATSGSKSKSKSPLAQHQTQQRKTPAKARVAAQSKPSSRAHQPPRKPTKLAKKQTKHTA